MRLPNSLYLVIVMAAFHAKGQGILRTTYYTDAKKTVKEMFYVQDTVNNVLEGSYTSYFMSGKIQTEGNFSKNIPSGHWKYYYESGGLKAQGAFEEGRSVGIWSYFYENGHKRSEGILEDNKKLGEWTFYYENEKIKSRGEYDLDLRSGVWNYFYEDGVLKAQAYFRKGVGVYKEFYASGNLKMLGLNKFGKSDSLWTYYYESGELLAEGYFKEGLKTGPWKYYHENGIVSSEGGYEDGETIGNWIFYYENGAKSAEGIQNKGLKDGYWKLYYETGEIKGLGEFENGTGEYKEYHSSGQLKVSGQFKDGLNEGRWTYYDENGDVEGIADYEQGVGSYVGYYYGGNKKMEGTLSEGKKIGEWKLYRSDGSLAGTYHPLYEEENPVFMTSESIKENSDHRKSYDKPEYRFKSRRLRYFTPRINEYKGGILAANPGFTAINRLPIALEYYRQERLGYELLYTYRKNPFYPLNSEKELARVHTTGSALSFRQKFYSPDQKFGMVYFGHEVGFELLEHVVPVIDGVGPITQTTDIRAEESRFHYGIIVGDRLMKDPGDAGFTVDFYIGIGIGRRTFSKKYTDNAYDPLFSEINQSKTYIPFIFGINIGYLGVRKLQNQ